MKGVCTRWAVVYAHDKMPVDGCLYVHRAKANKRKLDCANPEKHEVVEVAVMPVEVAHRMIASLAGKTKEEKINVRSDNKEAV